MHDFATARQFFDACETPLGWAACRQYVLEGAPFTAQSEPLAGIDTVAAYCDWMHGFGTGPARGARYTLHASAFDEATRSALFFATYHATHVGEGGPLPPTGKSTNSHYVYVVQMRDGKVSAMTKIWNSGWALKELGWA